MTGIPNLENGRVITYLVIVFRYSHDKTFKEMGSLALLFITTALIIFPSIHSLSISSSDVDPDSGKTYRLHHFKERKPFLSFRSRRQDPSFPHLLSMGYDMRPFHGDSQHVEKKDRKDSAEKNRWLLYSNYVGNGMYQKRGELQSPDFNTLRQYFRNRVWENL